MDDNGKKRGFSGLSDLVTDISGTDNIATPEPPLAPPKPSALSNDKATPKHTSSTPPRTADQTPPPPPKRVSVTKWVWSIVGIGILVALFNAGQDDRRNSGSRSNYSPSSAPSTYTTPRSTSSLKFSKPPVGTNKVLSIVQIRWCLREDMRIKTKRAYTNTNLEVDAFNTMVSDYNRRCGNFQYRRGVLERARREVEGMRLQIVAEALGRSTTPSTPSAVVSPPKLSSSAQSSPSRVSSGTSRPNTSSRGANRSALTYEVQSLLKQLGYEPGPIDGQYGRKTANAIKAFQRDMKKPQTSHIDQTLIFELRSARDKVREDSARRSKLVQSKAFSVERTRFFVKLTDKQGKQQVLDTTRVPFDTENSCYGWQVQVDKMTGPVSFREILNLPRKPAGWPQVNDDSRKITVSPDERSATTERTILLKDGWVGNMWCVGEGDPLGPYSVDVFINDKFIKTFHFDVVKASG